MAIMLLICLFDMPYGYYQLLRFVAMVVFGVSAFAYGYKQNSKLMIAMGALALLFQPLFPIALGRTMWNIVDVVVAIFLLYLWYNEVLNSLSNREKNIIKNRNIDFYIIDANSICEEVGLSRKDAGDILDMVIVCQ